MNNSKKKNKTVYNFCWLEKFLVKHSSYFGILSLAFNRSLYQKYPKISFFMLSRYSVFVFTLAAFLLFFALESNFELANFILILLIFITTFYNKSLSKIRLVLNLTMLSVLIFAIFFVIL